MYSQSKLCLENFLGLYYGTTNESTFKTGYLSVTRDEENIIIYCDTKTPEFTNCICRIFSEAELQYFFKQGTTTIIKGRKEFNVCMPQYEKTVSRNLYVYKLKFINAHLDQFHIKKYYKLTNDTCEITISNLKSEPIVKEYKFNNNIPQIA